MTDARGSTSRSSAGRTIVHAVLAMAALAAAIGGFVYWQKHEGKSAQHAAAPAPASPPVEVKVIEVQPQTVPMTPTYLGRAEASKTVEIRARVSGFLEKRAFVEGAVVQPGELLYEIDRRPFEAELAAAKGRLSSAIARRDWAQRQSERLQQAFESRASSMADVDQAKTEERLAAANIAVEEATVQQAELNLGYTRIESPLTGVIGRSLKDEGSYVQEGDQGLLATVQKVDPMYVTFSMSEQEIVRWQRMIAMGEVAARPEEGIPVRLKLTDGSVYGRIGEDGKIEPIIGRINFVSAQVDVSTGTALIRAEVPNPQRRLRPGQFLNVMGEGVMRLNALIVPREAVLQNPSGASVYVAVEDDKGVHAQSRPVTLGDWQDAGWIITDGLKPGDRVIVDRLAQMRPGAAVTMAKTGGDTPVAAAGPAGNSH